jgi:uncharacterized protein (DUF885 family)
LKADLAYPNWASDESRAQIMRDVDGMIADAQQRAARLFDQQPKAPVIARPFPRFRETNAAANYNGPPPDGSRPAVFQIPLRRERMTTFGLRSLVYHETIPGHHFQIALQVENSSLPRFRQIRAFGGLSAFAEGWGLYAERLAAESAGTKVISRDAWGSLTLSCSVPGVWSSTRASMRSAGRGSRRLTTGSRRPRSIGTSCIRGRRALT